MADSPDGRSHRSGTAAGAAGLAGPVPAAAGPLSAVSSGAIGREESN
ncbi:hypothetical protein [Kitasatospora sp. GAS1066B]